MAERTRGGPKEQSDESVLVRQEIDPGGDAYIAARDMTVIQHHTVATDEAQTRPGTPGQFREDIIALLRRLDEEACTGRLPAYLPSGADVTGLTRTVRARNGVRDGLRPESHDEDPRIRKRGRYRLPVERADADEPARPWSEVAVESARLIVLADPGLGKSWLIRAETHRLCRDALASYTRGDDIDETLIPVPVRCDQLVGSGQPLAEAAARYLAAQNLVPARSLLALQARINSGGVVLLLDALDELTGSEQYGQFKEMLRRWQELVGDRARCIATSRIAGYRGSPLRNAREVELLALTPDEVTAAVRAWGLKQSVKTQVLARIRDPAVGGMTRVPLLLALLCSLAAELPEGGHLPETRSELYERVLRWFLTRAHRAEEGVGHAELQAEEVETLLETLAPLAFHFATQSAGWVDLMPAEQLRVAIRQHADPLLTEGKRSAGEIVQELAVSAGILVPAGNPSAGRHPGYLFLHRTFAEYLVARHLAMAETMACMEAVEQHLWFDPDWTEVIPMLGGLLDGSSARRLLDRLLGEDEDPFHHALLTALRIAGERPDIDLILDPRAQRMLAGRILGLINRPSTRQNVSDLLAAAPKLPQTMVDRLITCLGNTDRDVRKAAVIGLAARPIPAVTDALIACISDPALSVRRAAVVGLANRDEPRVADALLARFHSQDYYLQETLVKALAGRAATGVTDALLAKFPSLGPADRKSMVEALADHDPCKVTDALTKYLNDADYRVRRTVVHSLASLPLPEVTSTLLGCLDDPDQAVRSAVIAALGAREGSEVTNALLGLLDGQDRFRRYEAVWALGRRDSPTVVAALLNHINDPACEVRLAVVRALTSRDTPETTTALLNSLNDEDYRVRRAVARALASRHGSEVTTALINHLDGPDHVARAEVASALGSRDGLGITTTLLRHFNDSEYQVRHTVALALRSRDTPEVTDALLTHLDDPSQPVRWAALKILAERDTPVVTEALLNRLNGLNPTMRQPVVQALASHNTFAVREALLTLLKHWDSSVRQAAVQALTSKNMQVVTDALLARLDDVDAHVRKAAVEALASRDTPEVTNALITHLDDPAQIVREAAVGALVGHHEPIAVRTLITYLNATDEFMRQKAADALTTRDVPDDLPALASRIQTLNPAALQTTYRVAERMADRVYIRLPEVSRARVRANLAWLTNVVAG